MASDGRFQINNIVLDIPPEQIQVERRSFNHEWQTLRTRSSMKVKSGFSMLDIVVSVAFTDDPSADRVGKEIRNGYAKLRDLVSQFRVTPFAYVENDFLRDSILGGNSTSTMALALKQLEITKHNPSTNVIMVNMVFTWFNYFPYMRNFTFKEDIFSTNEVRDPSESRAWKLMYRAEQLRGQYREVNVLDGHLGLHFNEFSQITVKNYNRLKKEIEALTKLRNEVAAAIGKSEFSNVNEAVGNSLKKSLQDDEHANILTRDIVGDQTSMMNGENPNEAMKTLLNVLDRNITKGKTQNSVYEVLIDTDEWKPVLLADKKLVSFKNVPTEKIKKTDDTFEKFSKEDTILLERINNLDFDRAGLIVTGITISIENILAVIAMLGHPFPTFQHIGSIDSRVTISLVTTDDESIRALSAFYSIVEEQAHKYRMVPSGHRNIVLDNDIANMCGLKYMLAESLSIETVPGSPGTYAGVLVLVDNPLDPTTSEKLSPGQNLTSDRTMRREIAKVLTDHLKLVDGALVVDDGFFGSNKVVPRRLKKSSRPVLSAAQEDRLTAQDQIALAAPKPGDESGYYIYLGDTDQRKETFKKLCTDFGNALGILFANLASVIQESATGIPTGPIEELYSLKDNDVVGIQRVQEDLYPIFQMNKALTQNSLNFQRKFGSLDELRDKSTSTIAAREQRTAERRNKLAEERISEDRKESIEGEIIKEQNVLSDFINNYLGDWLTFSTDFLDRILFSQLIELPEFQAVQDKIVSKGLSSAGDAYPDFPMEQVVGILQSSDNPSFQQTYRRLGELLVRSGLGNKNVGISALLNPDFYFFTPQNDVLDQIIPTNVMMQARDAIKASRESMIAAEKDWFSKVYNNRYLGDDKVTRIKSDLSIATIVHEKKEEKSFFEKTEPGKAYAGLVNEELNHPKYPNAPMAPNLLVGSVGSSIEQAKADGDSIEVRGNDVKSDKDNVHVNFHGQTSLSGAENWGAVKHRFETDDCLDFLPEKEYTNVNNINTSDLAAGYFTWPVRGASSKDISSKFGIARPEINSSGATHKGIDIARASGTPIIAAADGIITSVNKFWGRYDITFEQAQNPDDADKLAEINKERKKQGLSAIKISGITNDKLLRKALSDTVVVEVTHSNGYKTVYKHMLWDAQYVQHWSDVMWRQSISTEARQTALTVKKGDTIGLLGNTGYSTGPHLHFEVRKNGEALDPEKALKGELAPSRGPIAGVDPVNDSLFTKSIHQFERELKSGQGYSMMRAYPTFKLYFIESDFGERKRFGFDDFFSYSAVKDIQVIRSRKIAADLCIIQMTNISGVLTNRRFQNAIDPTVPLDEDGNVQEEDPKNKLATNTVQENPIASLMLQPGIQIQLRLGYSNNPEELETVFNGLITDVEFSDTDDLVQITCQSFAIELVQTIQGKVKSFGGFWNSGGKTGKILEEMLAFPEVVHFGRWTPGDPESTNENRAMLTNRWKLVPSPQDDNVFAPQGTDGPLGIMDALFGSSAKYTMYQTTIWDVFQEMALRHPSYIATAVPYEGRYGPRMTMYFGLPDQLYFARDSTMKEQGNIDALKEIVKKGFTDDRGQIAQSEIIEAHQSPLAEDLEDAMENTQDNKQGKNLDRQVERVAKQYALDRGFVKPFRSYHVLTSTMHILFNSISNSAYNCFNTATIQYSNKPPEANEDRAQLEFKDSDTFTLKADAAILDEEVREVFAQYPNCLGQEMAKQYAVGSLFYSLKEAYKGQVVIVGNPKIKPYDVCYIFDEYTDMFGPIEVEQVVHRFSQQTGFITEITPDLMVHVNQYATLSTADAMGLICEHGMKAIGMESIVTFNNSKVGKALNSLSNIAFSPIAAMFFNSAESSLGTNGSSNAASLVGTFIFRKLITRTQMAHPFRFSPLVLSGKPMIGGLPNRRTDGIFEQTVGKWIKGFDDGAGLLIDELGDRMNPRNWLNRSEGDLSKHLFGVE